MLEAHYHKSKDGCYGARPSVNAMKLMEGGLLQDYLNEAEPQVGLYTIQRLPKNYDRYCVYISALFAGLLRDNKFCLKVLFCSYHIHIAHCFTELKFYLTY